MDSEIGNIIAELATANHILFKHGIVDSFGHISVRSPVKPERFFLARSMAPGLVTPDDILEFDLTGEPVDKTVHRVYLERFIHSEIYGSRADVMSVVHGHSPGVIPFSASSVALCPICHITAFLPQCTPVFEISDAEGDGTDLLISDRNRARLLVKTLGSGPVVLMRGHGMTAVGNSIRQAVFRAIYTEINAKVQSQAISLGGRVRYLSKDEALVSAAKTDQQIDRAWDLWVRDLSSDSD